MTCLSRAAVGRGTHPNHPILMIAAGANVIVTRQIVNYYWRYAPGNVHLLMKSLSFVYSPHFSSPRAIN
jgi:hypothetical protein